jgi:O-antigen ligase
MSPRVSSRFTEGLLYAIAVFGPFAFGCVEPWSRAALETLIFLLALSCFLRGRPAEDPPAGKDFWLLASGFAALGVVQLGVFAPADGPRPLAPFTSAPHATRAAVLLWASYAALLYSVPRVVETHEAARRFVRFLFGLGIVLAAFGLVQGATSPDKLYWARQTWRAGFGPYYNRDHAANLMLMAMALGAGLLVSRSRRGESLDGPPGRHLRLQGGIATGALLLFSAIVICGSRGALLALLLSGAALALLGAGFAERRKERRARAAAALAAGAFVVFFAFQYVGAGAAAGARVDTSISGRFSIYGDARRWWRDAPLFGTGLGSFETVYPSYQDQELRASVAHAHSDWLEIALEGGTAGLLLAALTAALAGLAAVRAWRRSRSTEMRALIGGGLGAALAFAVHSLFEFCFQIPGNAVFFLMIVGFLLSAPAWADKAGGRGKPAAPGAPAATLAAAAFLLLAWSAVRPAAAAWIAGESGTPAERAASLTRAYALDPDPRFLVKLAEADYAAGLVSTDLKTMRASLAYSFAALARSPFDFQALSYAGAGLWRLSRAADSTAIVSESSRVRFSPLAAANADWRTGQPIPGRKR